MNLLTRFLLVLLGLCLVPSRSHAQYNGGGNFWKKHKTELYGMLGATSFLGELGGRNEIGSDYIYDFELNQTRWGITMGVRRFIKKDLALRGNVMLGYLAGNDNLTKEPFRMKRNLHFRSFVMEVSGLIEYNFRKGSVGNHYSISSSHRSRARYKETIFTGFIGVGALKFNPQGRYHEQWYDLRPLGTEGQNLGESQNKYSLFTLIIPVGLSYRTSISRKVSISLELCHRITFSDYIDDVSTVYFDQEAIRIHSGDAAAYFADPSFDELVYENGETVTADTTRPGLQRGDSKDNDSYMTLSAGASYKLNTYKFKRRRKTVGGRKRGKKRVF